MPSYIANSPVHLDGKTLEGGGQLLRLALSVSSLTHIPVHITDIRGNRGPKGKAGGLKAAHLAGAEWLANATRAETEGMQLKSRELIFRPSTTRRKDGNKDDGGKTSEGIWKYVYHAGLIAGKVLIRRDSHISMSTPGSIFLIFQAILPVILFSNPPVDPSTSSVTTAGDSNNPSTPVRITIQGGTNDSNAPSFEYIDQVLLPMLSAKVGIPPITMRLERRGWTQGRPEVGSVAFDLTPLTPGTTLPAFDFTDRGEVTKIHVSILASPVATRDAIRDKVIEKLLKQRPDVEILFPVNEDSRDSRRLCLLLVAETSSGYRLGRDWLYDRKTSSPKAVDDLVSKVVDGLEQELAHGGCVDEYLQDQLVVFQALAKGSSFVDCGYGEEASLHTKTVRWVVEQILGVKFNERGMCAGIAYKVCENDWKRAEAGGDEGLTRDMVKGLTI